ncbi:MAG: thiamine pyrophosphate-dependent enzyme [Pseudomonadota bacterium]
MSALDRRETVARLLRDRGETVVVAGLGNPCWDLAAAGDHDRNLYLWGAMGGSVPMALGLALARPETPVLCLTGDGEMMMGVGALAVVAQSAPANLSIVVLDNGEYGETGAQRAHTATGADLAAIARGAGLAEAVTVRTADALEALCRALAAQGAGSGPGPRFAAVKVARGSGDKAAIADAVRDAAYNRVRLRGALGLGPDR